MPVKARELEIEFEIGFDYGLFSRKNRLPAGGERITCFSLPTTTGALVTPLQLTALLTTGFCCNEKPVEGLGQATTTVLVAVKTTRNAGAPGVWTVAIIAQKPPSSAKLPPDICPASGCAMVPVTE